MAFAKVGPTILPTHRWGSKARRPVLLQADTSYILGHVGARHQAGEEQVYLGRWSFPETLRGR